MSTTTSAAGCSGGRIRSAESTPSPVSTARGVGILRYQGFEGLIIAGRDDRADGPAAQPVQRGVHHDAVQPGGDGGIGAEVSRAHGAARVFGVLDQVQHPEQQDCRRLPEIEHLRRPAQNHPWITQVSLEVIGRALRGALEQRLCVQGFLSRR
ncbi:MAG: hypothetical protein WB608_03855 [Terracidiphilus sp.]